MNVRLGQFMRAENLTAAKLAEILQVQASGISHLLSGRNKPNFDFIARMLRMFPNLNPDWLINGDGPMYRQNNVTEVKNTYNSDMLDFSVTNTHDSENIVLNNAENDCVTENTTVSAQPLVTDEIRATTDDLQTAVVDNEPAPPMIPLNENSGKQTTLGNGNSPRVEKVLLFYSDHSFTLYDQRN